MSNNGITVNAEQARVFLLEKVLKGKSKNVIFTFKDENGNFNYKVGADTKSNRKKLLDAFGEINTYRLPHEQDFGIANGGNLTSIKILTRLGYDVQFTEKDGFYPKNPLPVKNQTYQIDLGGNNIMGAYVYFGIDNENKMQDKANLHFLNLENDRPMTMNASCYDELMNNSKIVKIDDLATITQLVNYSTNKEHSIYHTRANGMIIKTYVVGDFYETHTYTTPNDEYPRRSRFANKDDVSDYLQMMKQDYPMLKFVTGAENLLDREVGSEPTNKPQTTEPTGQAVAQILVNEYGWR